MVVVNITTTLTTPKLCTIQRIYRIDIFLFCKASIKYKFGIFACFHDFANFNDTVSKIINKLIIFDFNFYEEKQLDRETIECTFQIF